MARILAALTFTAALLLAPPAHADDEPLPRLASTTVCVRADFPADVWRIGRAVMAWNAAQQVVRFTTALEPGCALVLVHAYRADDDRCGYASWERTWGEGFVAGGVTVVPGADVWVNDLCRVGYQLTKRERVELVAHELGHAAGLPHSSNPASVMYDGGPWMSRVVVEREDGAALAVLYRGVS